MKSEASSGGLPHAIAKSIVMVVCWLEEEGNALGNAICSYAILNGSPAGVVQWLCYIYLSRSSAIRKCSGDAYLGDGDRRLPQLNKRDSGLRSKAKEE
jgi:hypothetical protein